VLSVDNDEPQRLFTPLQQKGMRDATVPELLGLLRLWLRIRWLLFRKQRPLAEHWYHIVLHRLEQIAERDIEGRSY
jgi:hypothetical protein